MIKEINFKIAIILLSVLISQEVYAKRFGFGSSSIRAGGYAGIHYATKIYGGVDGVDLNIKSLITCLLLNKSTMVGSESIQSNIEEYENKNESISLKYESKLYFIESQLKKRSYLSTNEKKALIQDYKFYYKKLYGKSIELNEKTNLSNLNVTINNEKIKKFNKDCAGKSYYEVDLDEAVEKIGIEEKYFKGVTGG